MSDSLIERFDGWLERSVMNEPSRDLLHEVRAALAETERFVIFINDKRRIIEELNRIGNTAADMMRDEALSRNDQRASAVIFGLVNQLLGKLSASGTSGSAQDAEERLGPKGAGPAPEGGDAQ